METDVSQKGSVKRWRGERREGEEEEERELRCAVHTQQC